MSRTKLVALRGGAALVLSFLYTGLFTYITGRDWYHKEFFTDLLYSLIYFLLLNKIYRVLEVWIARRFKHEHRRPRNFMLEVVLFGISGSLLLLLLNLLFYGLYGGRFTGPAENVRELRMFYVINETLSFLYISVLTGLKVFDQLQKTRIRKKQLELAHAHAHAESLKNQISPHFLFNSLNALSSLIYVNPSKAQHFIEQLLNVFQYVLKNKDHELITLKEEVDFACSYFYLLKIRFRNNIRLQMELAPETLNQLLPPLSLQMLIENAVKHNIVSHDEPLRIAISSENNSIVVRNNLQQRKHIEASTGIGLKNIADRYRYLTDAHIDIQKSENEFVAKLPLIKPV